MGDPKVREVMKTVANYGKWLFAVIVLYIGFSMWKTYDFIPIPLDNKQMSPQFIPHDNYLGKRFFNVVEELEHGDVVYYEFPHHRVQKRSENLFFARVIGLPGDSIAFKKGQLYRNGEQVQENYVHTSNLSQDTIEEIIVPRDYVYLVIDYRKKYGPEIYYRDSRKLGPIFIPTITGKIERED